MINFVLFNENIYLISREKIFVTKNHEISYPLEVVKWIAAKVEKIEYLE